ncbi:ATP-binding protein [Flagellimonas ruestringensis]|uniref:hybrid sensor histidine kinase/response regulator transcription factor n=1 Tax=Flagellimonas ruestringensis TaxID=111501 RepID=UPI0016514C83|nr:ATP-binding protein [Allomuricauda ruestringensis]
MDSLRMELSRTKIDSFQIKTLYRLFVEYQKNSTKKAEKTILQAIELAEKSDYHNLLAKGYNLYGDFLRIQSREDSAIAVIKTGLTISERIGFEKGKWEALVSLGHCYWQKGDFDKAQKSYNKVIGTTKDLGGTALAYIGMGAVYSQKGEYARAMEQYTMASENFLQLGDEANYAVAIGNIGYIQRSLENYGSAANYFKISDSINNKLGNLSGQAFAAYNLSVVYKNMDVLDSATIYNKKGLELYSQLGYKKRISYCHFTMGEIHVKKNNLQEALESYQKSLDISIAVDDSVQIGYSSMAVADMYNLLGNRKKSVAYLKNAAKVASRMELNILSMDIHERLAKHLSAEGDMAGAYKNLEQFVLLKDSLYTREKRELASEIEAQYQNEQKTKEIALLASERELQTLQLRKRVNERNAIIIFAVLTILLAVLLFNQYRIKQRSNKELQELDRLKSNFFANISHEFRTPLTLIKGTIEKWEQNPGEKPEKEDVKMVRRNTNKVLGLVNQLLELSKIDQGKLQLKPTEGDVHKCLRTATSSFNSHAAQRDMDYRVKIPSEVLWAAFDRDKLEKVVYNLLSNAFKFSGNGECVSFTATYETNELTIQVLDSGKGISGEKLPFIFDRFYQVDSTLTKEHEGSGIGLSLSKDLIELMDGTITVASEEGKGSCFTVQIPIERIETGQPRPKEQEQVTGNKQARYTTPFRLNKSDKRNVPTILLVEDNEDMRQFIKAGLLDEYRILEAVNGEDGLKMAISKMPDLVITDLMMPKMDGVDLCKKMKTMVETCHIPIIMLTAKAGVENKIEGLETGADDYLTKPFETKELLVRARNLIEQRRKFRELFSSQATKIDPKEVTVNSLDEQFLEKVLDLLEREHADSDFGVAQMQKGLAMSKTQLHRKLKAITNESPGELLRNFRLKRAAQLLSQNVDSVTQVAYQVGFNNLSYFAKCFKELYGVSPSSY